MRPRNTRGRRQGEVMIFIAVMVAVAVALLGALVVITGLNMGSGGGGGGGGGGTGPGLSSAEGALSTAVDAVDQALQNAESAYGALVATRQPLVDAGEERRGTQEARAELQARIAAASPSEQATLEQELAGLLDDEESRQETESARMADYSIARERFQQALIALDGALQTAEPLLVDYESTAIEAQQEAARDMAESAGATEGSTPPGGDPVDRSFATVLDAARTRHQELSSALDERFPPGPELVPDELEEGGSSTPAPADNGEGRNTYLVVAVIERATEGEFVRRWVVVDGGYAVIEWDRDAEDSAASAEDRAADEISDLRTRFPGMRVALVQLDGFAEAPQVEVGAPLSRLDGRIQIADPGQE